MIKFIRTIKSTRYAVFAILLFLCSTGSYGQQEDFIFGQLVDSTQNEPIPFATIRIKNKAKGVITNVDGTFKIPLEFKTLGETLEISCLGYITKDVLIGDMTEGQGNIIVLKPSAFELNEAVVSANIEKFSAKQIVRIAVKSIPQNYPTDEFRLVGYYRDYQLKNGSYTNLSEAIIKVVDEGFDRTDNFKNQYQLFSYRKNPDFEIDSFASQPYDYRKFNKIVPNAKMENSGGNEFVTLAVHDPIRNYQIKSFSFIDDISSDFIDNHRFKLRGKTKYNGQTVYEIDYVFRNDDYLAEGKIYINTDDFAIYRLDYSVFKRKKPQESNIASNAEERFSDGFRNTDNEMIYRIKVEYIRGANKKMFLNYISFYNKILVQRPAIFVSKFLIDLGDNSFKVRVNKLPSRLNRIKPKDFVINYQDEPVPIKEFYFLDDERTFVICPRLSDKKYARVFNKLFEETAKLEVKDVKYVFNTITDDAGNILDERKWEYLHQYREFFTQETIPNPDVQIDDKSLMIVNSPLESPNQPIFEKGMKSDYWMNTPLQKIQN